MNTASTTVFSVFDNGNATYSGSIFQSSDQRLKTDISTLDASDTLALIDELNPVSYTRLDQPETGENLGFIAQQVQTIFPQLVSTTSSTTLTPDGTLTLNYVGLISPIVSAIQALSSEVQSLVAEVQGFAQLFVSNKSPTAGALSVRLNRRYEPLQRFQIDGRRLPTMVPSPRSSAPATAIPKHRRRPTRRRPSPSTATTRLSSTWATITTI